MKARAALIFALLSGCGAGDSVVNLTVKGGALTDVNRLEITATVLSGSGRTSTPETIPVGGGPLGDRTVPLVFPSFVDGPIRITVYAIATGALGPPLATGSTELEVRPSTTVSATVILGVSNDDLSMAKDAASDGGDDGPANDLAVGDGGIVAGTCACSAPANQTCLVGELYDFLTNTKTATGHLYRVAAYDALNFLGGGNTPIAMTTTSTGCYTLGPFNTPSLGALAMVLTDDPSEAQLNYPVVTGISVMGGGAWQLDGFVLKRTTIASWSSASSDAGAPIDYAMMGGLLVFYLDRQAPTDRRYALGLAGNTPVSGVQMRQGGNPPANARYLSAGSRNTLDLTLGATSVQGAGLFVPSSGIQMLSGAGGTCGGSPCVWGTSPAGGRAGHMAIQAVFRQ
jgi:hypothetical protein